MRLISILVLAFGVTLAGGAMYFASIYFEAFEDRMARQQPDGPKIVQILVAKTALKYGEQLVPNQHLRWQEWPEASVPSGAFTKLEDLIGPKEQAADNPRFVLRAIDAGEPVTDSKLTKIGETRRMAMRLRDGMRAFAIPINAQSGVAGFVAPGDRVDVLLLQRTESRVLLEDMLVIAVDRNTNTESRNPRVGNIATLEVTPQEAQTLALGQNIGRLTLTLRGINAGEIEGPKEINVKDLLGVEVKEEAPQTSVRVRKGGAIADELVFD